MDGAFNGSAVGLITHGDRPMDGRQDSISSRPWGTHHISPDLPARPTTRRSFFETLRQNPRGRHIVSRRTATFLMPLGTRHVTDVPAGKNPISPGPNRRSSPFSFN